LLHGILRWFVAFLAEIHGCTISPVVVEVLVSIFNIVLSWNIQVRIIESVVCELSIEEINLVASENQALRTHDRNAREMNLNAERMKQIAG